MSTCNAKHLYMHVASCQRQCLPASCLSGVSLILHVADVWWLLLLHRPRPRPSSWALWRACSSLGMSRSRSAALFPAALHGMGVGAVHTQGSRGGWAVQLPGFACTQSGRLCVDAGDGNSGSVQRQQHEGSLTASISDNLIDLAIPK